MPAEEPRLSEQFKQEVESTPHQLNHVEPKVKNVLPSKDDVVQEKKEIEFRKSIEEFDGKELHHVKPVEKISLPNAEQIAKEKIPRLAASFDKGDLHHVETVEKHEVKVIDQ